MRELADLLRLQAGWCDRLGSALYARLLERAAADVLAGGPVRELLRGHESDPPGSALALRLMGSVHRLVLEGKLPALARCYPSVGGHADAEAAWPAFRRAAKDQAAALAALLDRPVQTNEVGRSPALLGGFLLVARMGLPLRLLEVGASAALNLRWDLYRYESGGRAWGDPASGVRLVDAFEERCPPFDVAVRIAERRGCDRHPIDLSSADGEMTLVSYVWADQLERIALLREAIALARRVPVVVDRASAATWVAAGLGRPVSRVASVVFHSILMQYLADDEQERFVREVEEAGRRATEDAPLAWLRMEPGVDGAEVRLTTWPPGGDRLIAISGFHGKPVRWLAD